MLKKNDQSPDCHAAYVQSHILMGDVWHISVQKTSYLLSKNMMNRDCHRPEEHMVSQFQHY